MTNKDAKLLQKKARFSSIVIHIIELHKITILTDLYHNEDVKQI